MTQELLRRLTRLGTMYLIPADIHNKRIIRFTVTSQFTTADDVLKDWSIISKTASTLLAETQALNRAHRPKSGKDQVKGAEENQDPISDAKGEKKEDEAFKLDKAEVELWIDKSWNQSRRPMRSLSCSSEPLPYVYFSPPHNCECEAKPSVKGAVGVVPTPSGIRPDPDNESTEMPSNLPQKCVLKKLTKFYSVPSFCNRWVLCGHHQVSHAAQKQLTSTCRGANCTPCSNVANTAPEAANGPELL